MDFHSNPNTLPAELWEKSGAFANRIWFLPKYCFFFSNTQKDEQGPAGI